MVRQGGALWRTRGATGELDINGVIKLYFYIGYREKLTAITYAFKTDKSGRGLFINLNDGVQIR
ncbi:hypothetical protein D3C86_1628700 [compost metagenome]